ncbi:MAG: hypothetical protein JWM95_229 [Gemmatimonadetes bacterium]|nr:hypothetical protein [Gemmatimonadota bacterium]
MGPEAMNNEYLDAVRLFGWESGLEACGVPELRRGHISRLRTAAIEAAGAAGDSSALVSALSAGEFDEALWSPSLCRELLFGDTRPLGRTRLWQLLSKAQEIVRRRAVSPDRGESFVIDVDEAGKDGLSVIMPEDRDVCIRRVREANRLITSTSTNASKLVETFLRELALRRDATAPDDPGSYSEPRVVGRAVMVNPQADEASVPYLADAILHESIHSYVFMIEIATGDARLYDTPNLQESVVESPWTGRPLRVHFFVHASFIWFALGSFWRQYLESGETEWQREAMRLYAASQRGFRGKRLSDLIGGFRVSSAVRHAIEAVDERARNALPAE